MDMIINPWRYQGSAPPAPPEAKPAGPVETRLQSTIDPGGGGSVRVDAGVLSTSATRLEQLRGEVQGGVQNSLRGTDHAVVGRNLEVTKAVQYVHDRWTEKLAHLLEDMQERVTRVRKAADNWDHTEANVTQSMR
ncbi:hypothetical protein [Embleya scabrispora]|uniref:hypothetical protein n=1 Tax=Embleya scabrispora TaxID=159449 RepID=UPI00131A41C0|nr:hypothetical protein [Embleya scabrispora]MYS78770.1 hypothetical protein [Streptomyces sp. SID5474]